MKPQLMPSLGTLLREWTFQDLFVFLSIHSKKNFNRVIPIICKQKIKNFMVYCSDYKVMGFLFKEMFLENQYDFSSSSDTPFIIDCGANMGFSVLYFKYHFPKAKILAFEPNPVAFDFLKKNIEANNLKDINIHNVALSDREMEISFFYDGGASVVGSLNKDRGGDIEMKVLGKKLSAFMVGLPKIDLVKIDVEGAENLIVNDLIESGLLSKPEKYIIEYHHLIKNESSMFPCFLQIFETAGYKYNIIGKFERLGLTQDIIIYFFKST